MIMTQPKQDTLISVDLNEHVKRVVVMSIAGALRAASGQELQRWIDELFVDKVSEFVIDLTEISVVDELAHQTLCDAKRKAQAKGGDVRLVIPDSHPATEFGRLRNAFDHAGDVQTVVDRF